MVVNAIFNNISVISWLSVLLMGKTGVPEENHFPYYNYEKISPIHHARRWLAFLWGSTSWNFEKTSL